VHRAILAQIRQPDSVLASGLQQNMLPRDIQLIQPSDDEAVPASACRLAVERFIIVELPADLDGVAHFGRVKELLLFVDANLVSGGHEARLPKKESASPLINQRSD
jgi:hypothetical protein